ncbi:hypothetical protein MMC11_008258 [Xylographa trunciseda]|nr:hypothetical protein [Xylographa trunciseda]
MERTVLANEMQQHDAEAWETAADTSTPLGYEKTMYQSVQDGQTSVFASGRLGYQDHIVETAGKEQQWGQLAENNMEDARQMQQRLTPTGAKRQRQTKHIPVSTTESGRKRKRATFSHKRRTENKQPKRQKAEGSMRIMLEEQRQTIEGWIIVTQPIEEQGRNAYRTYACQELIAMQQTPQKLSMIARELAQEFELDSVLEQERHGIEATQRQNIYRDWRDQSLGNTAVLPHAPMTTKEQIPRISYRTRPMPVERLSRNDEGIENLEIEEQRTEATRADETQNIVSPQNPNLEHTENEGTGEQGLHSQSGGVEGDPGSLADIDWSAYFAEEYGIPIDWSSEEFDALLNSPELKQSQGGGEGD